MKFKFIRDVKIYGVTQEEGTIKETDGYDIITSTEIKWCIGHGHRHPLEIGVDIELLEVLD